MEYQDKIKLEWGELYEKYKKSIDENGYVIGSGAGSKPDLKSIVEDFKNAGIDFETINEGWCWYKLRPEKLVNKYSWNNNNNWYKITNDEINLSDDVGLIEAYNITTGVHKYLSKEDFGLTKEFTHCRFIRKNKPPFH